MMYQYPPHSLFISNPISFYEIGLSVATKQLNDYENEVYNDASAEFNDDLEHLESLDKTSVNYKLFSKKFSREKAEFQYLRHTWKNLQSSVNWWRTKFIQECELPLKLKENIEHRQRCLARDNKLAGDQLSVDNFLYEFNAPPPRGWRSCDDKNFRHLKDPKFHRLLNDRDRIYVRT